MPELTITNATGTKISFLIFLYIYLIITPYALGTPREKPKVRRPVLIVVLPSCLTER
jgi:hypothetical protein